MSYASTVVRVIVVDVAFVVVAHGFDTEIITLMCRAYANKQIRAHKDKQQQSLHISMDSANYKGDMHRSLSRRHSHSGSHSLDNKC